ncbi:MAG: DUF4097 family beta strand repeat protein [Clostridia bacterium]|nr:DUF4097 family beta strand repeat protein [Clostridia bacterium]
MKEKLKQYVELLFAGAANNERNNELKEELLGNLYDRYDDFVASGMSEEEAYNNSISSIGDLSELLEGSRQAPEDNPMTAPSESGDGKIPLYSEDEVEKKKKLHPILHAIAVALYIFCTIPAIIFASNISAVLLFVFVAAATAIFIYTSYTKPVLVSQSLGETERAELIRNKHMAGILRSVGVALYICCVCPVIIFESTFCIVLMFAMIAAATAIMILTSSLFPISAECEPQFKEAESTCGKSDSQKPDSPYKLIGRIISAILWVAVVIIYFAVSFATNRWWITWLIFPIAGLISGIISGIFNLITSQKIAGSIVKISLCSIFLCILLPAFSIATSVEDFPINFVSIVSADDSFYADTDDSSYTQGNTQVPAEGVNALDISWVAGSVTVEVWDGEYIDVSESGIEDENAEYALHSKVEGGKLIIKFSEERRRGFLFFGSQNDKALTVRIPESELIKLLEITSISSDITLNDLSGSDLEVSNVSGELTAKNCFFGDIDAEAVSGDIELLGGCRTLDVSMVSGNVDLELQSAPEEISVETVSGNVDIILPEDILGFTVSAEALSDTVAISYPTETKNGKYVFGDGSTSIELEAVSGKISVK